MNKYAYNGLIVSHNCGEDSSFKYNSTVNWMRALSVSAEKIDETSVTEFYKNLVKEKKELEKEKEDQVFEHILASIMFFESIQIKNFKELKYSNAHLNIIGWYYSIFHIVRAMIICKGGERSEETHTKTANAFKDLVTQGLIMEPFNLVMDKDTYDKNQLEKEKQKPPIPLNASKFPESKKILIVY